jgi:hypothetical protein
VRVLWAALICATALAACGGTGGSPIAGANGTLPATAPQTVASGGAGTTIQIKIRRGTFKHAAQGTRKHAEYVSIAINGLQISVQSGSTAKTVYADLSSSSALCTTPPADQNYSTCTIVVPTIGAQETFTALETDQKPTDDTNGYGTGFPNTTNILAAISQNETLQLGQPNQIGLTLGPVAAYFYDCTNNSPPPAPIPQSSSANFGDDRSGYDNTGHGARGGRIVVTGGVASSGTVIFNFFDAACGFVDVVTSPAPFVDVNASPVAITASSNSSQVTVAPIIADGTPAPASAFGATASFPNDGYYWPGNSTYSAGMYLMMTIDVSASFSTTAASQIVVNNNLTATNPFTGTTVNAAPANTVHGSMTYYVAAISASTYAYEMASDTTTTATSADIVGTDPGALSGIGAESAYEAQDGACRNSSGTPLASVAPDPAFNGGSINTSTWQQSFAITTFPAFGTCTFYLYDSAAGTMTQPITLTVF